MSRTPLEILDAEIRHEHVPGFTAAQLQLARDAFAKLIEAAAHLEFAMRDGPVLSRDHAAQQLVAAHRAAIGVVALPPKLLAYSAGVCVSVPSRAVIEAAPAWQLTAEEKVGVLALKAGQYTYCGTVCYCAIDPTMEGRSDALNADQLAAVASWREQVQA